MARGIAEIMGFRLMFNFNNPYTATGLGDFWNRWHISLSTWFKDYVYFPLGGSRGGMWATYRNMFITMVISGIWHGADWGFVIWGALHALARCLTREAGADAPSTRSACPGWSSRCWCSRSSPSPGFSSGPRPWTTPG